MRRTGSVGRAGRIGSVALAALALAMHAGSFFAHAGDEPFRPRGAVPVKIAGDANAGFRLERGGQPYFVRGVGLGDGSIASATRAGANTVRTWGAEDLSGILDEAHAHGLTVVAGIWLGHPRHGFNYQDAAAVARQQAEALEVVARFQDHPALLAWGLGNEMEGDGKDPAVWKAVGALAAAVKAADPDHPAMTIISEFGDDPTKLRMIAEHAPALDLVGVNSYGPVATLPARYARLGGTKPYLLTEFGPVGWWEAPRTAWGAALETTSTEKVEAYRRAYDGAVADQPLCVGSFAFIWGWKQEATATWFGLLLPDGDRVAAVDLMTERWTGKAPSDRCPTIEPLRPAGPVEGPPGASVRVALTAADPEGKPLQIAWELRREGTPAGGGDPEPRPRGFPEAIAEADGAHAVVTLPAEPGGYRLFATVRDGMGGAATANLPLHVTAPVAR